MALNEGNFWDIDRLPARTALMGGTAQRMRIQCKPSSTLIDCGMHINIRVDE